MCFIIPTNKNRLLNNDEKMSAAVYLDGGLMNGGAGKVQTNADVPGMPTDSAKTGPH